MFCSTRPLAAPPPWRSPGWVLWGLLGGCQIWDSKIDYLFEAETGETEAGGGVDTGRGEVDSGEDDTGEDRGTDTGASEGGGTTEDSGSSVEMEVLPEALEGFTWQLALSSADISSPPGVGSFLVSFLTDSLLLGVVGSTPTSIDMAVVVGDPGSSGFPAGWVLHLGASDFARAPDFEVVGSGGTLYYIVGEVEIPFEDPVFSGTMAVDGSELDTVRLTALVDTRSTGPLFGFGSTETATCENMGSYGVTCEACRDGEPVCLSFEATWNNAPLIPNLALARGRRPPRAVQRRPSLRSGSRLSPLLLPQSAPGL